MEAFKAELAKVRRTDPKIVRAAMEQEKREREEKRKSGNSAYVPPLLSRPLLIGCFSHLAGDLGVGKALTSHSG